MVTLGKHKGNITDYSYWVDGLDACLKELKKFKM